MRLLPSRAHARTQKFSKNHHYLSLWGVFSPHTVDTQPVSRSDRCVIDAELSITPVKADELHLYLKQC